MKKINLLKATCQHCFALRGLSHLTLILIKIGNGFLPSLLKEQKQRGLAHRLCGTWHQTVLWTTEE